jgi:hypothetical protein
LSTGTGAGRLLFFVTVPGLTRCFTLTGTLGRLGRVRYVAEPRVHQVNPVIALLLLVPDANVLRLDPVLLEQTGKPCRIDRLALATPLRPCRLFDAMEPIQNLGCEETVLRVVPDLLEVSQELSPDPAVVWILPSQR